MMKKKIRLLTGVLVLAAALTGCGSTGGKDSGNVSKESTTAVSAANVSSSEQTDSAKELDVLKVGLAALPTQLDPDRSIGIASIKLFYNIFDTLLFTDKEGNICGQLAESWEWVDDKTLNVKLRKDVTFQNGEPCTSEDVKFTFDRILSGYGDGPSRYFMKHWIPWRSWTI